MAFRRGNNVKRQRQANVVRMDLNKEKYLLGVLDRGRDMVSKSILNLPHFGASEPGSLPRITESTLLELLQGAYDHVYNEKVIIDCRFEYEYAGGHIQGALNYWDREKLVEWLFRKPSSSTSTLVVLYCEYSEYRAPLM
jgi:hypothetical protein